MTLEEEEELLLQIGHELHGPSIERQLIDRKALIKVAKRWLEENNSRLRKIVCENSVVTNHLRGSETQEQALVKSIADALCGFYVMIPCASIAQYIVSKGLSEYCRNHAS